MRTTEGTRAIFFDLDGTLTDPKPGITGCIQHAMKELGHKAPNIDELEWCIGPPLRAIFVRLLETNDEALIDRALALYRERFGTIGLYENALYEEIPATLRTLRTFGYLTFVVTSKASVYADRIVRHFALSELFEKVYGSELSGIRSDKGELIAHVMIAEKLSPPSVVMVGDREHDVIGANKNGVPCIGVTYGYGTEQELRRSGALSIAAFPRQIIDLVECRFG